MKQTIPAIAIELLFVITAGNPLFAQSSKNPIESGLGKGFMSSVRNLGVLENPELADPYILNRNEINIWAVRDFMNRFDQVDNAVWFAVPKGGFEAYFIRDGYGDRVIYDKNGGWQLSLLIYNEEKLPRDIRSLVKSTYFDFDITLVEEVHTIEGIEYIVYLEDKINIRVLKVTEEGGMEVFQELNKSSG